jgi:hypothetical protein
MLIYKTLDVVDLNEVNVKGIEDDKFHSIKYFAAEYENNIPENWREPFLYIVEIQKEVVSIYT